ncbi:hypothetical protein BDW62DRAFT_203716 [Aspergillus aurantiobrunneus]
MTYFPYLDMYIGVGRSSDYRHQAHWVLILAAHGSTSCTFYHIKGGPTDYQHFIEVGQSLHDPRLTFLDRIGCIPAMFQKTVYEITRYVQPRRCHWYIVAVLHELENTGLLGLGHASHYEALVQPSMWEVAARSTEMQEFISAADLVDVAQIQDSTVGSYYHVKASKNFENPITYEHRIEHNTGLWFNPRLSTSDAAISVIRGGGALKLEATGYIAPGVAKRHREAIEPSLYEVVKNDKLFDDTIFDLSIYALFNRLGKLKDDKCCY